MTGSVSRRKQQAFDIIFGTESTAGKAFDVVLIMAILISVGVVIADSIPELHAQYGYLFWQIEWGFTLFFSVEYLIRIWCSPNPRAYVTSGFGVVDVLSVLPTYLAIIVPQAAPLLILRVLRILRIFRILRLLPYVRESTVLLEALRRSRRKNFCFLFNDDGHNDGLWVSALRR